MQPLRGRDGGFDVDPGVREARPPALICNRCAVILCRASRISVQGLP